MSEQTTEVPVVTTLPATEEPTPEKKFFDTKKKVALFGAAAAAAAVALYVKVKKNSKPEEDVLWTEAATTEPQTSENETPAS